MRFKKFGIYRYHQYKPRRDQALERVRSFETMDQALQSLLDLTRRPKDKRIYLYTILPNVSEKRYILLKEEQRQQVIDSMR